MYNDIENTGGVIGMGNIIRNCKLCGESMNGSSPFTMCPTCLSESNSVRSIFRKNPKLSMEEVSHLSNVPLEKIKRLVKLGLSKTGNIKSHSR